MRRLFLSVAVALVAVVSTETAQAQYFPSGYYGAYRPGYSVGINFGYNPSYGSYYGGYGYGRGRYDYVPGHIDRHHGHSHYVAPHVDYLYRGRRYPVTTDAFGQPRVLPYPHRD